MMIAITIFVHMSCTTMFLQMEDATVHSTDSRARNSEGSSGEAILVLGGEPEHDDIRDRALEDDGYAGSHFREFSWQRSRATSEACELDVQMVELSWKAVDTVTNFSTMIPVLLAACVSKVFLVTSDYHMHRAAAVAAAVVSFVTASRSCVYVLFLSFRSTLSP